MAEVVFQHVSKLYSDGTRAVDDLTLEVRDGEFVVIVGPSGSGKTTALRMVAGLEEISEGTISIGDRVVNDVPARRRNIAMVFQSYALYPHLTVHDNLAFGLETTDVPRREIERRIGEAVTTLELDDYLRRKPKQLSGGQRQRVALGRAIVRDPAVFLMDEPLSNLDAQLRVHTRTEIRRLQRRLGVTTIYVTHDQVEAMTMADRVAVMRRGRLQQFAPPEELYARPGNAFVAGFIGSPAMNFVEGTLERANGKISVLLGQARLALDASTLERRPQLAGYEGKALVVGIRPETIQDAALVPDAPAGTRLHGTVEVREALGPELYIHFTAPQVRLADAAAIADLPPEAGGTLIGRFSSQSRLREGDDLEAVVDTGELHFFDPATLVSIDGAGPADVEQRTPPHPPSESVPAAGGDVDQLAGVLRGARSARRQYLAELRQGDVEPAEDWSTWYAEYLLGLR